MKSSEMRCILNLSQPIFGEQTEFLTEQKYYELCKILYTKWIKFIYCQIFFSLNN